MDKERDYTITTWADGFGVWHARADHMGGEVIAMDEINCQECGREITEREAEDYGAFCSSCG